MVMEHIFPCDCKGPLACAVAHMQVIPKQNYTLSVHMLMAPGHSAFTYSSPKHGVLCECMISKTMTDCVATEV